MHGVTINETAKRRDDSDFLTQTLQGNKLKTDCSYIVLLKPRKLINLKFRRKLWINMYHINYYYECTYEFCIWRPWDSRPRPVNSYFHSLPLSLSFYFVWGRGRLITRTWVFAGGGVFVFLFMHWDWFWHSLHINNIYITRWYSDLRVT